ncbi:MAG TPA: hypothetical protein VMH39_08975 [Gemmatimonadaceae bacterium]|nr:hypothetical protein [Gemmatimonadaceae bacterium]
MAKTLQQTVQNWTNGAAGGQQAYVDGINGTTVDVVGNAIAAQSAMVSGFTQAVTSGRWARNLQAVGTSGWKTASVAKAANWGVGISAGQQKYQQAMSIWLPIIDSLAAQAKQMPGGTTANRIARSQFFLTQLAAAKASGV